MTIAPNGPARKIKPRTGLVRGQAAAIARRYGVTIQHVIACASGKWRGRAELMATIAETQEQNRAAYPQQSDAA